MIGRFCECVKPQFNLLSSNAQSSVITCCGNHSFQYCRIRWFLCECENLVSNYSTGKCIVEILANWSFSCIASKLVVKVTAWAHRFQACCKSDSMGTLSMNAHFVHRRSKTHATSIALHKGQTAARQDLWNVTYLSVMADLSSFSRPSSRLMNFNCSFKKYFLWSLLIFSSTCFPISCCSLQSSISFFNNKSTAVILHIITTQPSKFYRTTCLDSWSDQILLHYTQIYLECA